ncbi:hypothetical protein [Halorhabdus salina]|uniref:hypothetical protein n=1 Tax=Halorhabdus salina TaxID=2750670 RepID=UPI00215D81A4|nr:hypothetical protein [Halorhabdus salina]
MLGLGAGLLALAGGGVFAYDQFLSGGQGPTAAAKSFIQALDDGDAVEVRSLAATDSPIQDVSESDLAPFDTAELEVQRTAVQAQTETSARIEADVSTAGDAASSTLSIHLQKSDGEWLVERIMNLNAGGFLQSSAEESGEQAAEQVTNRLVEVNTVGTVGMDASGAPAVTTVEMTVRLAPGSGDVTLDEIVVQLVQSNGSFTLAAADASGVDEVDGGFVVTPLRDNDSSIESNAALNDPVDRATLEIGLDGEGFNIESYLSAGSTAEVQLQTSSGGHTTITLVVPEALDGKDTVSL